MSDLIVLSVVDFGEMINRQYRKRYYPRGDVVQLHAVVDGLELWVERNRTCGEYRVAFGSSPVYGDLMPLDQAQKVLAAELHNCSLLLSKKGSHHESK